MLHSLQRFLYLNQKVLSFNLDITISWLCCLQHTFLSQCESRNSCSCSSTLSLPAISHPICPLNEWHCTGVRLGDNRSQSHPMHQGDAKASAALVESAAISTTAERYRIASKAWPIDHDKRWQKNLEGFFKRKFQDPSLNLFLMKSPPSLPPPPFSSNVANATIHEDPRKRKRT